jgi:hypothetical protein
VKKQPVTEWDATPPDGVTVPDHFAGFMVELAKLKNEAYRQTQRPPKTFLVVFNRRILPILAAFPGFVGAGDGEYYAGGWLFRAGDSTPLNTADVFIKCDTALPGGRHEELQFQIKVLNWCEEGEVREAKERLIPCPRCSKKKVNGRGFEDNDTRFPDDCHKCGGEGEIDVGV